MFSVCFMFKRCEGFFCFPTSLLRTRGDLFSICPGSRLLDGSVADATEATALTFNVHLIDIYVWSRGPRDDGGGTDGPNSLTERAPRLQTHKARLSSSSSNRRLSDGEQTEEPRLEGQNVECWDFILFYCKPFVKL